MKNNISFEEWSGGASPAELIELKDRAKKRMVIYLLLSLIPFVNIVTVGLAIFCYNNISYIDTRGRSNGNDLLRFILMVWGFLIPPIIVVSICSGSDSLGNKVLGWNN